MNFVSIILYFGTVIDRLLPLTATAAAISLILCGGLSVFIADSYSDEVTAGARKARKAFLWILICCIPILVFTPNSQVLYLIAASELGEEVVTNPEVVEVATELKDIILEKIKSVGE